ncbi:hypothetical protein [Serratia marcescens]|uniref:hypothetical protein n=1 Tax=Serratia marcescens TaxID=615 RepID=UPI00118764AD|nr:hypothetical protein [Serratia marcescens]
MDNLIAKLTIYLYWLLSSALTPLSLWIKITFRVKNNVEKKQGCRWRADVLAWITAPMTDLFGAYYNGLAMTLFRV